MLWTGWILLSAVFLAFYDIAKKTSVRDNAVLPTLLGSTIFGCIAFTIVTALRGGLSSAIAPGSEVMVLSAAKAVIVSTSWIFTFSALRTLPVTIATPIRASAPALVFIIAFFAYGEVPTILQAAGMVLVFAGYFAFSWAGRHEGIDFFRNRAVWCAFGGMFFSALSAIFDKFVFGVRGAPVNEIQFWFQIDLVIVYALVLTVSRVCPALNSGHRFVWRWSIPFVGILLAGADWLYFTGISDPSAPISVAALMRRFSVVITFLLGAKLLHETNLRRKALALASILSGILILAVA